MTTETITLEAAARPIVTVDAAMLLQAIRAVLPHVEDDEDLPTLRRVRLDVLDHAIEVLGTSRATMTIARLADENMVDTGENGEATIVDLLPSDAVTIGKMFKPGKDEQITLRLDLHPDGRTTFTDVSGLFDGRALTVPTAGGSEGYPDIRKVIAETMDAERGVVGTVTYTGDLLRRFATSAGAYNDCLHIEPTAESRPFVVTVGDNFIGLLMPQRNDPSITAEQQRIRDDWRTLLPS